MSPHIQQWLRKNGFGTNFQQKTIGGGSICDTSRLSFSDGRTVILKCCEQAPAELFSAEALGLSALKDACALTTPEVIHVSDRFLILEDLGQGNPDSDYWQKLGQGLADLHRLKQPQFGFRIDNYCGSTPQRNSLTDDGFEFFANYRILNLAAIALKNKLLSDDDMEALETIAGNLQRWLPKQTAVLIHGDLWSGNIHCCANGQPALIDPAVYWGWAEAELAMTTLFGGFDRKFYSSYEENSDIESDWRERAPLYNLYHLLNHLLLFGSSYLPQLRRITAHYGAP